MKLTKYERTEYRENFYVDDIIEINYGMEKSEEYPETYIVIESYGQTCYAINEDGEGRYFTWDDDFAFVQFSTLPYQEIFIKGNRTIYFDEFSNKHEIKLADGDRNEPYLAVLYLLAKSKGIKSKFIDKLLEENFFKNIGLTDKQIKEIQEAREKDCIPEKTEEDIEAEEELKKFVDRENYNEEKHTEALEQYAYNYGVEKALEKYKSIKKISRFEVKNKEQALMLYKAFQNFGIECYYAKGNKVYKITPKNCFIYGEDTVYDIKGNVYNKKG